MKIWDYSININTIIQRKAINRFISRKVRKPEKNGYAPLHRVNASKKLGRPLRSDEVVHHIDGNKKNNRKSNLQVMSKSEHYKIHYDNKE